MFAIALYFAFSSLLGSPLSWPGHQTIPRGYIPASRPRNAALICAHAPCVFRTSTASAGPQPTNDTAVAIDPANRTHLISTANDYNCVSLSGTYASLDNGRTWLRSCAAQLSGTVGEGSPDVVYGLGSLAYRTSIDAGVAGGVAIERSADGGVSWSAPVLAGPLLFVNAAIDFPAVAVDSSPASPYVDSVYVVSSQFDAKSNTRIAVGHSYDHGATWATVPVGSMQNFPTLNNFPSIAVGPDGSVYAAWMQCTAGKHPRTCGGTTALMLIVRSSDGGVTWTAPVKIHAAQLPPDTCRSFYGCLPNSQEPMIDVPHLTVDTTGAHRVARVYATDFTYQRPGRIRVRVSASHDSGATWRAPTYLVPPQMHNDQFMANSCVGTGGVLDTVWLDRRNDPYNVDYQPVAAVSTDGGATFSDAIVLSTAMSNPANDGFGGTFLGEHLGCAPSGGSFVAAWTDTSNGTIGLDVLGGFRP